MRLELFRHPHVNYHLPGQRNVATNDPGLSRLGQDQLNSWTGAHTTVGWDHIYSSNLKRSEQAAEKLSRIYGVPHTIIPRLEELQFPAEWEGGSPTEANRAISEWLNQPYSYDYRKGVPGGETFAEHRLRVNQALDQILEHHEWDHRTMDFSDQTVAVIGHRHTNSVIISTLLGHRGYDHPYLMGYWTSVAFERRPQGHWEMEIGEWR